MDMAIMSVAASALTAIIISVIGVLASRKKDEASAASELSDSSGALVDRLEKRLDKVEASNRKLEEKYCTLERKYDDLLEDYKLLELVLRDVWDGGRLNISQLKELNKTPRYEPSESQFRGQDGEWVSRPD
ncbi:MAG: hypothetical protein JRJ85_14305 [Deltaproteobacteria bacterium]|nr:hypothetical protein [Deltaproteobacteria bacterium]